MSFYFPHAGMTLPLFKLNWAVRKKEGGCQFHCAEVSAGGLGLHWLGKIRWSFVGSQLKGLGLLYLVSFAGLGLQFVYLQLLSWLVYFVFLRLIGCAFDATRGNVAPEIHLNYRSRVVFGLVY